MSKNILIRDKISPYNEQLRGGSGTYIHNLCLALAEHGWNIDVLCPYSTGHKPPKMKNLNYYFFDHENPTTVLGRVGHVFRGKKTVSKLVNKKKYELIIDNISHLPHFPLQYHARSSNTAIIIHNLKLRTAIETSGLFKGVMIEGVERVLPCLNPDQVICAGPSTERRIHKHLDFNSTCVLPPCVDTSQLKYKFDKKSNKVLFLGRLTRIKNVGFLLDVWDELVGDFPDHELIVAGSGPEKSNLEKKVRDKNIDNVTFPGFVQGKKKKKLLENSLMMVIPSMYEGYVTTGLEGMAAGTIVVGSNRRGINDYVTDSKNGYLFPYNDKSKIKNILVDVLEHPGKHKQIAEAGYETAMNHSFESFSNKAHIVISDACN